MLSRVSFFAARVTQRFCSSAAPHIPDYLREQQEALVRRGKSAKVSYLSEGECFVGPNVQVEDPDFVDTVRIYPRESLPKLSDGEKQTLSEMEEKYCGRLVGYEVRKGISCITSETEHGAPVHYVPHHVVKMYYLEDSKDSPTPGM